MKSISPTGLVPFVECHSLGDVKICDSLAICEFLAESHPELPLWPRDRQLRALARSSVAQMHSGFTTIRNSFGTNFVGQYTGNIPISEDAHKEIVRLLNLWDSARTATKERLALLGEADEGFLYGGFSIADAFFWPTLTVSTIFFSGLSILSFKPIIDLNQRFRTYNLPLEGASAEVLQWMAKIWNDPVFKGLAHRYHEQAKDPETRIEHYDDIFRGHDDIQYSQFPEDWKFSYP